MIDYIVIALVVIALFFAGRYIYKEKKAGKTCVGCPYSGSCGGTCSGQKKEK